MNPNPSGSQPDLGNEQIRVGDLQTALFKQKDIIRHLGSDLAHFRELFLERLQDHYGGGGNDFNSTRKDVFLHSRAFRSAMANFGLGLNNSIAGIERIWSELYASADFPLPDSTPKEMSDRLEKGQKVATLEIEPDSTGP